MEWDRCRRSVIGVWRIFQQGLDWSFRIEAADSGGASRRRQRCRQIRVEARRRRVRRKGKGRRSDGEKLAAAKRVQEALDRRSRRASSPSHEAAAVRPWSALTGQTPRGWRSARGGRGDLDRGKQRRLKTTAPEWSWRNSANVGGRRNNAGRNRLWRRSRCRNHDGEPTR